MTAKEFLMESKQQSNTPYWVIERKCDSGFKYWQIFNKIWVDDIYNATKWYIKSEAEAYLIHGHFTNDYVAEHIDIPQSPLSNDELRRELIKFSKHQLEFHFDETDIEYIDDYLSQRNGEGNETSEP